ncbi:MAG: TonB-dependent receptor [Rikenellaceae bacterium]|nr:TonB-dependent receptor [Rikenellaceae bacterium]MCL2692467.1 TonB-dependent receptor [Rikenellaceae bacterium]
MKKIVLLAGLYMAVQGGFSVHGRVPEEGDFWRKLEIDSVVVRTTSTRASATTPMTHTNVSRAELDALNFGQDMPFLLRFTPSVVVTSEAGAGVGYTALRIRGTDASRINVTINGIPMNDPESHGLFWVNTPDLASSLASVQIQRGVGTSTNGAGAFGASINMLSEMPSRDAFGELAASYGSYNTSRRMVRAGTGLLNGGWAFEARLSEISSDGYRDRAWSDMSSYFVQGGWFGARTAVRLVTFGGKEQTYHAWNGITREQIKEHGRRYNPSGAMNTGGWYKNQTDNYRQTHYQLLADHVFTPNWGLSAALHYTRGEGYYEEYRNNRTLRNYLLEPFETAGGVTVTRSNLVQQKHLDNHFGGGVFSLDYRTDRLSASLGGAANLYDNDHFGRVVWIQNYVGGADFRPDHEFYRNNGHKADANVYLKASWEAMYDVFIYGDMQFRHINYTIEGTNDRWITSTTQQWFDLNKDYNFFNPKAGVFWRIDDRWNAYGSVAVAHREPARRNFTNADPDKLPLAERLVNFETGAAYRHGALDLTANIYYMSYKDQMVLTGKINHVGDALAENVANSYRAGIEIVAGVDFTHWLRWDATATLSRNRICNYTEFLDDYDAGWSGLGTHTENFIGNTDISFSPAATAASSLRAQFGGLSFALRTSYVSRQYVTNSAVRALSLDPYCVSDLFAEYTFRLPSTRSVTVGVAVNNIFSAEYESNGYGSSSMVGGTRVESMYFFPQATINVLANIIVRF